MAAERHLPTSPELCSRALNGLQTAWNVGHRWPLQLFTLMVILVTSACVPLAHSPSTSRTQTPSASSAPSNRSDFPTVTNTIVSTDVSGLHIDGYFYCAAWTVLAGSQLAYDAGQIQAMQTYLADPYVLWTAGSTPSTLRLPPTLRLAEGDQTCVLYLQLTNTGAGSIQIARAGVKTLAQPQPNTFSYRLIDVCSVVSPESQTAHSVCAPERGGSPMCGYYSMTVQLASDASVGSITDGTPTPDPKTAEDGTPCPTAMVINPTDSAFITVNLSSNRLSLAYQVLPSLTLRTARGLQTVTLAQFPSSLAFAAPSQFTCYALQGDTFTVEARGNAALSALASTPSPQFEGCL